MHFVKCYYSLETVEMPCSDIFKTAKRRKRMAKKYFYNNRTHRLHINGYCRESKRLPFDTIFFDTYDEALAYDARAVGMCKLCQKKENQKKEV